MRAARQWTLTPIICTLLRAQTSYEVMVRAGGSNNDEPTCATNTPAGIVVGGVTESADGTFTAMNHGGQDGFLLMVAPWGGQLWALTIGGSSTQDWLNAVAYTPRRKGLLVAVGSTFSEDGTFATTKRWGKDEGFVVTVSASTGKVKKVRLLGGSLSDVITDIALLPSGNMLICGYTSSRDGIFEGARMHGTPRGNYDLWVSLLKKNGKPLWTTVIAGNGDDMALALTTHNTYVYVAGTSSSDEQPWHAPGTGYDALIAALALSTGEVLWVKTVGGEGQDEFRDLVVRGGQLVAVGSTSSERVPGAQGAVDIYLAGVDNTSGRIIWQRAVGSQGIDWAVAVACPEGESACVCAGTTTASSAHWQVSTATDEILLLTFSSADGKLLRFATAGGSFVDRPAALVYRRSGLYVAGSTSSEDWAVADAVPVGGQDIVLVRVVEPLLAGELPSMSFAFGMCVGCIVRTDLPGLGAFFWEQAYLAGDTILVGYGISGGFLSRVRSLSLGGFELRDVTTAFDSLLLVVGNTFSGATADAVVSLWMPQGTQLAKRTLGGPRRDQFDYAVVLDSLAVVVGTLYSSNSFTRGYRGSADLWLTVWRLPALELVSSVAFGTINNDMLLGACVRSAAAIALVGTTAQATSDGILIVTDTAGRSNTVLLSGKDYDALTDCWWEGTILWLAGVSASADIGGKNLSGRDALLLRQEGNTLEPIYVSVREGDALQARTAFMGKGRVALVYVNSVGSARTDQLTYELVVEVVDVNSRKSLWQTTLAKNADRIHLHAVRPLPDNSILICGWMQSGTAERESLMEVVVPRIE